MLVWKLGEQREHEFKNTHLRGFRLALDATAKGFNSDVSEIRGEIDLSEIFISCTLNQNGVRKVLLAGDLETLGMETNFNDNSFDFVAPMSGNAIDLLTGAADKYQRILIPIEIMLGSAINLKGSDSLKLDVKFGAGACEDGTIVDAALMNLYVSEMTAIDVQFVIPVIETHVIPQNQQNFKVDLGDNVQSITFINKDKLSDKLADQVIRDVRFMSDRFNCTKDYYDLLVDRVDAIHHDYDVYYNKRNQSFELFSGKEMDQCSIELNLNSVNVNAGKNFLVVRRYENNPDLLRQAIRRTEKHDKQLEEKLS